MVPAFCLALVVVSFVTLIGRKFLPEIYGQAYAQTLNGHGHGLRESPIAWQASAPQFRDVDMLRLHGLDGYLLLRYLKFCVALCLGGSFLLCSVLLPLNATGNGGMSHLDVLTIANIQMGSSRLYAHACCTAVFFGWVLYMVAREKMFYIKLMHAHRVAMERSENSEARTLLFTNVPKEMLEKNKLGLAVGRGENVEVWLVTHTKSLRRDLKHRSSSMDKIDTIMQSICHRSDVVKRERPEVTQKKDRTRTVWALRPFKSLLGSQPDFERLKKYIVEIARLRIEQKQIKHQRACNGEHASHNTPALMMCAIARYPSVRTANLAYHSLHDGSLTKMSPQSIGARVRDILWDNFGLSWWQHLVRRMLCRILVMTMIVFWSFPVALVTAFANIDILLSRNFIHEHIPTIVQTAFRGLLPSLMLSLLMSLPPRIIARLMRFSGCVTLAEVEVGLQHYYFFFRVVQVFLVAALGSTASSILVQIYSDPSSAATILAKRLPGASNFYLSYIVVQGLSESAFVLLNIEGLFSKYVLSKIFDDTPRKRRRRHARRFEISAGTVLATSSSLLVVAICYAPLAPLMLCFAACAFAMFYLVYRYNLLTTTDLVADTAGKLYEGALQNALVGLYIGELCLIGILTVASVGDGKVGGPLMVSCALLVCTIIYQKLMYDVFKTLSDRLLHRSERQNPSWRDLTDEADYFRRAYNMVVARFHRLFMEDFALIRSVMEGQYPQPPKECTQASAYVAPEIVRREQAIELTTRIESDVPPSENMDLQEVFQIIAARDRQTCYCSSGGDIKIFDVQQTDIDSKEFTPVTI